MGWNFVKYLSVYHELHIITESKFEKDITSYLLQHPDEAGNMHFYFIKKERHKKLRKIYPPSYYWFYKQWQRKAFRKAYALSNAVQFDVVHQLNMAGYREPGYFDRLDLPLVWGPVGGLNITPWQLLPSMGFYGMVYYGMRNVINLMQMHFGRRVGKYALGSDIIIASTKDNHDRIKSLWKRDSAIIPEVGFTPFKEEIIINKRKGNLKICWSGLHIPRKALNLLLLALYECRNKSNIEVHVLGEGRCTPQWKKLARQLGLSQIKWYGWLKKEEAISVMNGCHLLCITSLSDLTSTVLLEALSLYLPVIAPDHCGFSNVITDECGIKIPLGSKKEVCSAFAKAIDNLYENEAYRLHLSGGARKRALDFRWDDKAKTITRLYREAIDNYNSR